MKTLCVIPARYASVRFPGKPLALLHGQSMIQRVYDRVLESHLFSKIVVATDDQRILQHCVDHCLDCMMTSDQHISGTDRVAEVARSLPGFDIVINVQGDEPDIEIELLSQMVDRLQYSAGIRITTGVSAITRPEQINDPNVVKVVFGSDHGALYFSRSTIPYHREGSGLAQYWRHVGTYGFTRDALLEAVGLASTDLERAEKLEQLRWLQNGMRIHCIPGPWKGRGIDTPEDIERWENDRGLVP